jgi:hypothetical protein
MTIFIGVVHDNMMGRHSPIGVMEPMKIGYGGVCKAGHDGNDGVGR